MLQSSIFANEKLSLAQITKHIQSIKKDLKNATHKKINLQKSLQQLEISESHITQQLSKTHKKLLDQRKQLSSLNQDAIQLTKKIDDNKQLLSNQIHTAYFLSRQPAIKYLLNTDSIQQYQRTKMYFKYFTKAQTHIIENLQTTLEAYKINKSQREKTLHNLYAIEQNQLKNKAALHDTQRTRKKLIHTINKQINTKKQKLAKLTQDKSRLEKTLAALDRKQLAESLFKHPFYKLQNKLIWPINGKIHHHFGDQVEQSELTWNGVLIDAKSGTKVHAPAAGKVIFAKWLQGYGLLMIIDHGNGYMTLYGRNQSLLKKVDDWVKPGMIIATAGKTGGFTESALYFSIRHNAKPLNPEKWCTGTPKKS